MFTTIIFAVVFIGLLIVSIVLWALCLQFGLRWARATDITWRRIIFATAIVMVLQIANSVLFALVPLSSTAQANLFSFLEFVVSVIINGLLISTIFKLRFLRAIQAWLPTLLMPIITLAFAFLVFRPNLYEIFIVPTNSMAPTLVGNHWQGVCPECGQPNFCSPSVERHARSEPSQMICGNFHVTQATKLNKRVRSSDRFIAAKFLSPRRWDLVVFKSPSDAKTQYVKRLVGLPGEMILIKDGAVWVDGKRQTPPDSLHGIEYLSELPNWHGIKIWGSGDRPAKLGNDEYFVLGDFSAQSIDSRLWEEGAPGHNPFAVPESYLKGVVTHTYWPPQRWRIHR